MRKQQGSGDTTVVAVYTSRHNAEIAQSFLEDRGIHSFVAADDVHVPLQLTEGARLHVMESEVENAAAALRAAHLLPSERGQAHDSSGEMAGDEPRVTGSRLFLVAFVLLLLALIAAMIWVNVF